MGEEGIRTFLDLGAGTSWGIYAFLGVLFPNFFFRPRCIRSPLVIPASRFVIYFHSDNATNDWGYKVTVKAEIKSVFGSSASLIELNGAPIYIGQVPPYIASVPSATAAICR